MCGEFVAFQIAFFIMHVRNLCAHLAYFVVGDFIFGRAKYKRKVGTGKATKEATNSEHHKKKRNRAAVPLFREID